MSAADFHMFSNRAAATTAKALVEPLGRVSTRKRETKHTNTHTRRDKQEMRERDEREEQQGQASHRSLVACPITASLLDLHKQAAAKMRPTRISFASEGFVLLRTCKRHREKTTRESHENLRHRREKQDEHLTNLEFSVDELEDALSGDELFLKVAEQSSQGQPETRTSCITRRSQAPTRSGRTRRSKKRVGCNEQTHHSVCLECHLLDNISMYWKT